MKSNMLLKIKQDVKKQFDVGFLEVEKYPEWVANIVSILKKDEKVRMCVDYQNLYQEAKNYIFSFMDVSRYNQIRMAPDDMEKITFVTIWGIFAIKLCLSD